MYRTQRTGSAAVLAITFVVGLAFTAWGAWAGPALAQSGQAPKLRPLMRGSGPLSHQLTDSPTIPAVLPGDEWAVDFLHYPSASEVISFVHQLEGTFPHLVCLYEAGQTWQGKTIIALRLGNERTGDPDRRPACYVDGQHHAREPLGQLIALYQAWYLLTNHGVDPLATHLLDTRTVYIIPSVNPDGNDIWRTVDNAQRKNANPTSSDDDRDGLFDEDPPEGLGYGSYELLRLQLDSGWVATHPEDPFVDDWEAHIVGQPVLLGIYDANDQVVPQVDNDGDGKTNEDPIGGVDPNRNYDSHWYRADSSPRSDAYRGSYPWSEPEVRAVRDLVLEHGNILTGISYHSGTDMILHPWGWSPTQPLPDWWLYEQASAKGSQLTECNGFHGSPHGWGARALYQAPAITMDWLYEHGVFAWAPETYGASRVMSWEPVTSTTTTFLVGTSLAAAFTPSPEELPSSVARWNLFSLYILALTPNTGVSSIEATPEFLTIGVANDGYIPVRISISVEDGNGSSQDYSIERLQSGERRIQLPRSAPSRAEHYTVTLEASVQVGAMQRVSEQEIVAFRLDGEGGETRVLLDRGQIEPWTDLGSYFGEGDWLADPRRWDTPSYHLGPAWATSQIWLPGLFGKGPD